MSNASQQIVNKAWSFAHVLRDDGLSYMAYTEQITFLLFLKMADEQTRAPYNKPALVPKRLDWASLLAKEGEALEAHYRKVLDDLSRKPGMLGEVFKKARPDIQNPATLKRLIVDLIDPAQKKHLRTAFAHGWELVPANARRWWCRTTCCSLTPVRRRKPRI